MGSDFELEPKPKGGFCFSEELDPKPDSKLHFIANWNWNWNHFNLVFKIRIGGSS
jgi:hypothetical protein